MLPNIDSKMFNLVKISFCSKIRLNSYQKWPDNPCCKNTAAGGKNTAIIIARISSMDNVNMTLGCLIKSDDPAFSNRSNLGCSNTYIFDVYFSRLAKRHKRT